MRFTPFLFLFALVLLAACGGGNNTTDNNTEAETTATDEAATEADYENEPLYAWVENLNLRDKPSTSGKVIASVQPTVLDSIPKRS